MNHRSIFTSLLACVALGLGAAGCAKPKDDDCKNAIANIRNLYGTAGYAQGTPPQAAVRSCRGSASREAVQCIIAAKSIQELQSCTGGGEFLEAMKDESATQAPQAPAQPTPTPAPAPAQPQQDPAQPQQAPAQQDPAQPQQAPAQQDPAQPAPAQPEQAPAPAPAQPQDPAENPGQPAAPGRQPPAQ